jgi:hypothetical protein
MVVVLQNHLLVLKPMQAARIQLQELAVAALLPVVFALEPVAAQARILLFGHYLFQMDAAIQRALLLLETVHLLL